jgi:hypothetical protein
VVIPSSFHFHPVCIFSTSIISIICLPLSIFHTSPSYCIYIYIAPFPKNTFLLIAILILKHVFAYPYIDLLPFVYDECTLLFCWLNINKQLLHSLVLSCFPKIPRNNFTKVWTRLKKLIFSHPAISSDLFPPPIPIH